MSPQQRREGATAKERVSLWPVAAPSANKRSRTRMSPEARRAQLVGLGVQMLMEEPLEEVTVPRIAEEAGVSRALVFHYFPTVRDLHLACLDASAQLLVQTMVNEIDVDQSGDPLRKGLETFVDYISQQPNTFLAMAGYSTTDAEFGGVFESVRQQLIQLLITEFELDADALCRLMLRGWVGFVEAAVIEWLAEPMIDQDKLIDILVATYGDVTTRWNEAAGRV